MKRTLFIVAHPDSLRGVSEIMGAIKDFSEYETSIIVPYTDSYSDEFEYLGAHTVIAIKFGGSEYELSQLLSNLARKRSPDIILAPSGIFSCAVMAQTAAKLKTGLTADCTFISVDENGLMLQKRPAFGGGVSAHIYCKTARPQMATLQSDLFAPAKRCKNRSETEFLSSDLPAARDAVIIERTPVLTHAELKKAKKIIIGGKGVGSAEGFALLGRLAKKYGAALGATRAAVDAGFADYSCQIGQSGASVSPDICLLFGVSGAIQHISGICASKTVIAVNNDKNAPVFEYADIALIADWRSTAQALMKNTK